MRFPYTEQKAGVLRPLLAVEIFGPSGPILTEGLLDTGADRTLLTLAVASRLGLDLSEFSEAIKIRSVTGHNVEGKVGRLAFRIARHPTRVTWIADFAVVSDGLIRPLWGIKGFLEYFRVTFDGPKRLITLNPGRNLPSTILTS